MKQTLLLLTALTLSSCNTEEEKPCGCEEQRYELDINYKKPYKGTVDPPLEKMKKVGKPKFFDCNNNGKTVSGTNSYKFKKKEDKDSITYTHVTIHTVCK